MNSLYAAPMHWLKSDNATSFVVFLFVRVYDARRSELYLLLPKNNLRFSCNINSVNEKGKEAAVSEIAYTAQLGVIVLYGAATWRIKIKLVLVGISVLLNMTDNKNYYLILCHNNSHLSYYLYASMFRSSRLSVCLSVCLCPA